MLQVVTGGSGSGKSEYAEGLACGLAKPGKELIYIAAMKPYDEECRQRIARHRKMRAHKGFRTIECYEDIDRLILPPGCTVLLECMSNLLANEQFSGEEKGDGSADERILEGLAAVLAQCENLVVVTNEIFSDGVRYDGPTAEYQRMLGRINCKMAAVADRVVEVVCGIALVHKGERHEYT